MSKIMIIGTNMMSIYNHRLELIKNLLEHGYQVTVVAPASGEEKKLIEMGVAFVDTPVDNRGTSISGDMKLLKSLKRTIKAEKPDVVLTFYTKTNIYGGLASASCGVPYIENITGLGTALTHPGVLQTLMKFLYKRAIRKASIVYFQNEMNRDFFIEKGLWRGRWKLLPGSGVSLERYSPLAYPGKDKPIEFLFVSRILKEKGIDEYLDAARIVKEKYPEVVFDVVGPCEPQYADIMEKASTDGLVKYYGKVMEIRPFIENSHCTVFPSYYAEGMANVLLESASSCRPLITTAMPGCGETVDDGSTGFIVPPRDGKQLADCIIRFIEMPYEKKVAMGIRGRAKMEKQFDRDIITKEYLSEIDRILSKGSKK